MKKKLILAISLVALLTCIFAISAHAALIKLETDPGLDCDDSLISTLDYEAFNNSTATDKESKVVMTDGTYFYVFPAYYVFTTNSNFQPSLENINAAMKSADASITDDVFTDKKVNYVRIELPTWISDISQGTGKLEGWTGIKEFRFGTTLKKISAHNAFTNCSNLEFVSDFSHITAMGDATFSSCTKLEIDVVWPSAITYVPGSTFSNTAIKSITFKGTVTNINSFAFNKCINIKEVTLPNTLTSLGKGAFSGCKSMETFRFSAGFTTLSRVNADYETFYDCDGLKYVYMPAGFLTAVANASAGDYKHIFNGIDSNVTFFFTGTEAEAVRIKELMALTNNNPTLGNAKIEAYNQSTDYTNYGTTVGSNVIVYGYSACNAFYDGVHTETTTTYEFEGEAYTTNYRKVVGCSRCTSNEKTVICGPLFVNRGYSKAEDGSSFTYGITINDQNIAKYVEITGESFKYGFVVGSVPTSTHDQIIDSEGNSLLEKTVAVDFTEIDYEKLTIYNVKIVGIDTDEQKATSIYCCAYVIDGSNISYMGEAVTDKAVSVSSNSITVVEATASPSNDEENA